MDVKARVKLCRLIEKIKMDPAYAEKIKVSLVYTHSEENKNKEV